MTDSRPTIDAAEVDLPGAPLDATVAFFTERLSFRIESVFPADDPAVVVVSGYGVTLRLRRDGEGDAGTVRLRCAPGTPLPEPSTATAPNGTRVVFVAADDEPAELLPLRPSLVVARAANAEWIAGRAGMLYRDLVPDRQGGRFIASHIRIPDGGPVPDYIHSHRVRFQVIFCVRGQVKVVYEDQGPPFVLGEGDGVLQPPGIRHRVLECSPGLEVVEVSCPASHLTTAHHDFVLPTEVVRPERTFGSQRFVRHESKHGEWTLGPCDGWESCPTGVGTATDSDGDVTFLRAEDGAPPTPPTTHRYGLSLRFVLAGEVTLDAEGRDPMRLATGDSVVVPAGRPHAWSEPAGGLRLLWVTAVGDRI